MLPQTVYYSQKKSCMAGRRSCSGCCFGAEYPSPCGGAMWSMGQNMVLQHSKVLPAESKKSARGSLCTPLKLWFSAGLRYLLQDPLHQISIHSLTPKNQSGISVFPSKTQSVCLANNKALRDLIQKGFFLRVSMTVTDWRDADLHLLDYKAVVFLWGGIFLTISYSEEVGFILKCSCGRC